MSSSPIHAASLVDPATHNSALLELVDLELSKPIIQYLVESVTETVDFALGRPYTGPTPYTKRFFAFAQTVLERAEVTTATVLTTLVYLSRARPHLSIALEEWALERVFLGALIVASKYTNDSTLRNVHWALCTGVFGKSDVGRIEREFLEVLDWELGFKEADIMVHHQALIETALPHKTVSVSAYKAGVELVRQPSTPDLEPSSPVSTSSTLASSSPQTPAHSPVPVAVPTKEDVSMDIDDSEPARGRSHKRTSSSGVRLHHLLRSIPFPSSHRHRIHV